MAKIKPCLFCGDADVEAKQNGPYCDDEDLVFVECNACGANGPYCSSLDYDDAWVEAINKWNSVMGCLVERQNEK